MARSNHIINAFTTGEISQKFAGQVNTEQYNQGCDLISNAIVGVQGGVSMRPGTQFVYDYVDANGDPNGTPLLVPFVAANGDSFILLLNNKEIDDGDEALPTPYFEWRAINTETLAVVGITSGQLFSGDTAVLSDLFRSPLGSRLNAMSTLQWAQSGDVLYFTHPDVPPFTIQYKGTGWTVDAPFILKLVQNQEPTVLYATEQYKKIPFAPPVVNKPATTLVLNYFGGIKTIGAPITVSGTADVVSADFVGSYIKFNDATGGSTIVVYIDYYTVGLLNGYIVDGSTAVATGATWGGSTTARTFEVSAYNGVYGWPRAVAFYESRLVFGGSETFPDNVYFSRINNLSDMMQQRLLQDPLFVTPLATDPFATNLKSNVINKIQWILPGKNLTVGTQLREFIFSADGSTSFSALNIPIGQEQTPHGSAYRQPIRIENTVIFMQRNLQALRELIFDFEEDSYKSPELNVIAEHMSRVGTDLTKEFSEYIVDYQSEGFFNLLAWQALPIPVLWVVDDKGILVGLTRDKLQNIVAWHRHQLAGNADAEINTDVGLQTLPHYPKITSIATIPVTKAAIHGNVAVPDELWLATSRPVFDPILTEPILRDYIEVMAQPWEKVDLARGWDTDSSRRVAPVYMDCAVIRDEADDTTLGLIENLPHGEGSTVGVILNGAYIGTKVVGPNGIDITEELGADTEYQVIIGFEYNAEVVPVTPEVPAQTGSSMGQLRRVDQITIHFYKTCAAKYGKLADASEENSPAAPPDEIAFAGGVNQTDPPPMFTGTKTEVFPGGTDRRPRIRVLSNGPFPWHVTHVVARMFVNEG